MPPVAEATVASALTPKAHGCVQGTSLLRGGVLLAGEHGEASFGPQLMCEAPSTPLNFCSDLNYPTLTDGSTQDSWLLYQDEVLAYYFKTEYAAADAGCQAAMKKLGIQAAGTRMTYIASP